MALISRRCAIWLLLPVVAAVACQAPGTGAAARPDSSASARRAEAVAAVRAADSALQRAVATRDAERTAAFYAEDAALLPVAEPAITGRAAIRAEWVKLFAIPGFTNVARLVQVEVSESGDLAYTRGTYASGLTAPDGKPVTERGKWVSIWRRQADGAWRVVVDIYNTDALPPEHM